MSNRPGFIRSPCFVAFSAVLAKSPCFGQNLPVFGETWIYRNFRAKRHVALCLMHQSDVCGCEPMRINPMTAEHPASRAYHRFCLHASSIPAPPSPCSNAMSMTHERAKLWCAMAQSKHATRFCRQCIWIKKNIASGIEQNCLGWGAFKKYGLFFLGLV